MAGRWREIPWATGYLVSDQGEVYSKYSKKVAKTKLRHGYPSLSIQVNGKTKSVRVHRLVAELFVDGDTQLTVNHKDKNRQNNHYTNLEWVTREENIRHGLSQAWTAVDPDGECVVVKNLEQFCVDNNLDPSHMSKIANGNKYRRSHKGWSCVKGVYL